MRLSQLGRYDFSRLNTWQSTSHNVRNLQLTTGRLVGAQVLLPAAGYDELSAVVGVCHGDLTFCSSPCTIRPNPQRYIR